MVKHSERESVLDAIAIDRAMMGYKITCKAGCAYCCSQKVMVLESEIDDILLSGVAIDPSVVKAQTEDWDKADKTCVFLKDNLCQLHDKGVKPLVCHTHISVLDPHRCIKDKRSHGVYPTANMKRKQLYRDNPTVYLHEELHKRLAKPE
jgi:Fe-S-cluster containining protein